MMRLKIFLAVLLVASGCGGGSQTTTLTVTASPTTTAAPATTTAAPATTTLPPPNFELRGNLGAFSGQAQDAFKAIVDDEFTAMGAYKSGMAVAVFTDGRLWTYAIGDASATAPMTTSTPTLIRSTSKTFEAALILDLVEDGRFQLTDSLESVLSAHPDYSSLDPTTINSAVTVHELLSMRSGIRPYAAGAGEANNTELIWVTIKPSWKPADTLGLIKDPWVAPGEYEYSDSNNYLLGMVAELHTGKDLSVLYRERFLNPLDLSAALLPDEPVPEGTARPYTDLAYWGGSGFGDMIEWDAIQYGATPDGWHEQDGRLAWATAGIVSTPANIARWGYELYSNNGSALSEQSRTILLNSISDETISLAGQPQRYGYYVAERTFPLEDGTSLSVLGHPGGGAGYTSRVYYSPSLDMSLSILANSDLRYAQREGGCSEYGTADCIAWGLFKAYAE